MAQTRFSTRDYIQTADKRNDEKRNGMLQRRCRDVGGWAGEGERDGQAKWAVAAMTAPRIE